MSGTSIKFYGIREMATAAQKMRMGAESRVARGTRSYLKAVFRESQRLVPVSADGSHGMPPGTLRDSGHITEEFIPGVMHMGIEYDTHYAIYVHEELDHKHTPPTQAKFLETPFFAMQGMLGEEVNKEVRGMVEETWHGGAHR
jgi:hypothetical protein